MIWLWSWCCRGSSPSSSRAGEAFFAESVGQDLLRQGDQRRRSPTARRPGYYFAAVLGDVLAGRDAGGDGGAGVWAARREPGARFLLAWLVPSWIVFELVLTKLPHYVLPLYPAIAILIAGVVDPHVLSRERWLVRGTRMVVRAAGDRSAIGAIVGARSCSAGSSACWPGRSPAAAMIFGLLAWRLYRGRRRRALAAARDGRLDPARDRDLTASSCRR